MINLFDLFGPTSTTTTTTTSQSTSQSDDNNPEYLELYYNEAEEEEVEMSELDYQDCEVFNVPTTKSTLFQRIFEALEPLYKMYQQLGEEKFKKLLAGNLDKEFNEAYAGASVEKLVLDEQTIVKVNNVLAGRLLELDDADQLKQVLEQQYQLSMLYQYTPFKAVKFGAVDLLQLSKKSGKQFREWQNKNYQTLFALAVAYNQYEAARVLLKELVDQSTSIQYSYEPVIRGIPVICSKKDTTMLRAIQEEVTAVNLKQIVTMALSWCADQDVAYATFLSAYDPKLIDRRALLTSAISSGQYELAKFVIECADLQSQPLSVNSDDIQGVINTYSKSNEDKIKLIDFLVSKGAQVTSQVLETAGGHQPLLVHLIDKYIYSQTNPSGLKLSSKDQQSIFQKAVQSDQQGLLRMLGHKFDVLPATYVESKKAAIRSFRLSAYRFFVEKGVRIPEDNFKKFASEVVNLQGTRREGMLTVLLKDNRYCQLLLNWLHQVEFMRVILKGEANREVLEEVLNAGIEFSVPKSEVPTFRNERIPQKTVQLGAKPKYYKYPLAANIYYHSVVPVTAVLHVTSRGVTVPFNVNSTSISHALKLLDNKMEMVVQGDKIPKPNRVNTQPSMTAVKKQWLYYFLFKGSWIKLTEDEQLWNKWSQLEYKPSSGGAIANLVPIRVVDIGLYISSIDGNTVIPPSFKDIKVATHK